MSDNGSYYSEYSTDTLRVYRHKGFYCGAKAAQNATTKLHVSVHQIKLNAKGKEI